jgi:hypothetical protein
MTQPLWGIAFAVALTIAAPVWAQAPTTADDLNRQELRQLTTKTTAPVVLHPAMGYSIASPAAPPQIIPPAQPNFTSYYDRYPAPWLYRYYGYQPSATYEYINTGSGGYYAPVLAPSDLYWD